MDEKEMEKTIDPLVVLAVKILQALTNQMNCPDTSYFYKKLLEHPEVNQHLTKRKNINERKEIEN